MKITIERETKENDVKVIYGEDRLYDSFETTLYRIENDIDKLVEAIYHLQKARKSTDDDEDVQAITKMINKYAKILAGLTEE
ncbi:hypothetical protein [Sulfurisphaera ohwakuensis]|uniref:hypothetical protein n=1 Tax=Sulfurisphaera ohwakuensis TaxID=69656 RepID=UPI0036F35D81